MDQILIAWIGGAYIDASLKQQHGSISATLKCGQYSHAYLSYNFSLDQTATYIDWLKQHKKPSSIYKLLQQHLLYQRISLEMYAVT